MTKTIVEIKMYVEGYKEISEKRLAESGIYHIQLQTSFINENGDLEKKQVKLLKEINIGDYLDKCVKFKNVEETKIDFNTYYKATDLEIIDEKIDGIEISKYMIMDVFTISDKTSKDKITQKDVTHGFVFSKNKVDGAVETFRVKVKNSNRKLLEKLQGQKIKLNNLSEFKPSGATEPFYSIDSIKDISIIKKNQ